jgi:large subunit ribosomal protein L1
MSKKASKRHRKNRELVEKGKAYALADAVSVLKKAAPAKFNETVEMHIRLGVDPKKADQQVRGTVILPHGTGKALRVAVLAKAATLWKKSRAGSWISTCSWPPRIS